LGKVAGDFAFDDAQFLEEASRLAGHARISKRSNPSATRSSRLWNA
jgi:hypothetical protein